MVVHTMLRETSLRQYHRYYLGDYSDLLLVAVRRRHLPIVQCVLSHYSNHARWSSLHFDEDEIVWILQNNCSLSPIIENLYETISELENLSLWRLMLSYDPGFTTLRRQYPEPLLGPPCFLNRILKSRCREIPMLLIGYLEKHNLSSWFVILMAAVKLEPQYGQDIIQLFHNICATNNLCSKQSSKRLRYH